MSSASSQNGGRSPAAPVENQQRGQSGIGMGGPDERRIDDRETHARVYTPMKPTLSGLKELLLARRPNRGSADIAAIGARALFQAPESATTKQRENLVEFLGKVSLFEDLAHRDLARVARIVHERQYSDGEYICEEGRPGAALFVVRRGVVEVVKRGPGGQDVPLALLEPPASFEESAAIGAGVIRWFCVRARGPVSLLALGKSDLDTLILNFPPLATKVLTKLAGIMAARLQMLIDAEIQRESEARGSGAP
jgi:CRP/FNR family transcriptional regulator, cyclic AMP receptor protein